MNASKSYMNGEFKVEIDKRSQHVMPELHYHDYYEIYIQDQGSRDHIVNNIFYKLNPGDVMLIKPNVLHQSLSPNAHVRTIVYFTDKFLKTCFSPEIIQKFLTIFDYNFTTLSADRYFQAANIIREMEKESCQEPDNMVFIRLAELFMVLLKNIKEQPLKNIAGNGAVNVLPDAAVSPLISYIHENFLTLNSIGEIASTFYITSSHLCRTFKKLTGYTVIQYINIMKIQRACNLLRDTSKSITDIALDCGFNSTMYFCKTFKSVLNLTPTEYRKAADKSIL